MSVEIRNESGNRTLIFLPGGSIGPGGIQMLPLDQHSDYQTFLKDAISANWRIVALSGIEFPDYYEMMISNYVATYARQDGRKPTLMGHSAGGVTGLCYAIDCPEESMFDRLLLFNAPLIYPDTRVISELQNAYVGTDRITANVTLTMSEFDDEIMSWKLGNFTMMDAINVVKKVGKVTVLLNTDNANYKHSPFDGVTVAWDTLNSS